MSLFYLADPYRGLGDYEQAIACLDRSGVLFRQLDAPRGQSEVLRRRSECHLASGDITTAIAELTDALAIADELRLPAADSLRASLGRALAMRPDVAVPADRGR